MSDLGAALSGLTTRGRCLLSASLALLLGAALLGQRDLLRAAVFLAVLPVAAAAVVARTRYSLGCTRRLDPPRTAAGRSAQVRLRLDNVGRLPTGVLHLEDGVPYSLGERPRFVLDRIEPHGARELVYEVVAAHRGRYRLGPLAVRLTDPFGLCELTRAFADTDELVVTPHLTELPPVSLGGDRGGAGETAAVATSAAGTDDVSTREYRHGDDLRKVHWRSTARAGELMVRREEQPVQSRAALLLDTRAAAHRGSGPASSFEAAVSAVASLGVSLLRSGHVLRLLTDDDRPLVPPGVPVTEPLLLDALASVDLGNGRALGPVLDRLRRSPEGVLVAVLGALDEPTAGRLARLRSSTSACTAVLLDVDSWGSGRVRPEERDAAADVLRAAGWRVVALTRTTPLDVAWSSAAGRGRGTARPATPVPAGAR